ncbi:PDZ domain-containing protein [Virgibacillus pantothenticus]|uniref:PDZ domain-containing protein n=1 Tax=Virgibacillus pantothenticus TaxID=1473 RepID=UPI002014D476|nr:PDZ domain-containing protein [Virgibacillus pantothenticus]
MESWLLESAKGIGRLFLNPLFYWAFILIIFTGIKRIKREREDFGIKVYDLFSEWKYTWGVSIIMGLFISAYTLGVGVVLTYPVILLLGAVAILLSLTGRLSLLSASYIIGIAYLILLFVPKWVDLQSILPSSMSMNIHFSGLTSLLAILLLAESIMLFRARKGLTYPELTLSKRGGWVGQHHLKKMAVIPFFTLIPTGSLTPFADYWPYFTLNDETYSLILIPFLLGFDHIVRAHEPSIAATELARSTLLLSLLVGIFAFSSIYYSVFSLIAVLCAILGRELINYRYRIKEQNKAGYFQSTDQALKVLAVLPDSPADRLGIKAGTFITKVNGTRINQLEAFYHALQTSGAFFKLEIINKEGEVELLQGAWYQGDHHGLGLFFTSPPHNKQIHNTAEAEG